MTAETLLRTAVGCLSLALVGTGYLQAQAPGASPQVAKEPATRQQAVSPQPSSMASSSAAPQRALFDKYCVTCHNQKLKTAGLMLDTLDVEHVGANADVWEKVVRKLRSGAMPPAGRQRPDKATYGTLASWLETEVDRAAAAAPNPGRGAMHRLNRVEYANAIRDLLALEIDGRSMLPADDSGYGFDNIADVLSVSPALMERYLLAAGKISRLAIGDSIIRPTVETYKVSFFRFQDDRISEDLPFGSRGGIAIRHHFPLDGEYVFKVHLQKTPNGNVRGLADLNVIDVRLDGGQVKTFTVGGMARRTITDQYNVEGKTIRPKV